MDYGKVLKRSWEILWRYRVLWVFGVIVALTAAGGGGEGVGPQMSWSGDGEGPGVPTIPPEVVGTLVAIGVGLLCLIVILAIVGLIAQYVSQTALIRMVDDYEETGEKRGVRQGFRLGWSRTALRLFIIDLLTRLPSVLVAFLLVLLGLGGVVWMFLTPEGATVMNVIGAVAYIGLSFLLILVAIVVSLVVSLFRQFFFRVCALEELGVIESLRQGYQFVRRHLRDAVLMWLIMIGLEIAWMIVMIPMVLVLLVVAALVGGLPALLVGGLAAFALEGPAPWILAAVIGLPIFILVMVAPLTFLGGLAEVFKSSVWTLTYRELRALEGLEAEPNTSES
ncbi:MAG: hypothetical protein WBB22_08720 [Anaerolineae bacterium]